MSFLAPLFLLGGLAIALPVLFHLVRKTTRERTRFSSLIFLRPEPPRLTRRNRLEHLLLLLLRCAVIVLLALGFARPFWRQAVSAPPPASEVRKVALLLDTSASMRRDGLWNAARTGVETWLRQVTVNDQVALFAYDHELTPLVTFEQWRATPFTERVGLVRSRLTDLAPGWGGSQLDEALVRAAEALAEVAPGEPEVSRRELLLFSDLQSGSHLEKLQSYEWPKGIEVTIAASPPLKTSNAGLQLAAETAESAPAEAGTRLRVSNEPDSRIEQFQLGWQDAAGAYVTNPLSVYVPAGQNRIVVVPPPPEGIPTERILLRGDDEPFDNTLFAVPPQPANAAVLYLGTEPAGDTRGSRYFLTRALQQTRRLTVELLAPDPGSTPGPDQFNQAALLVVTEPMIPATAQAVAEAVRAGKTVLFAPKTPAALAALSAIPELATLQGEEGRFTNYGLLGEIDFRHPLFVPFADPRFSDFTKIHFWKYRRLNADALGTAAVLARFDNGDPALVEVTAGKGRVFVLASGWHAADSQLALSSKFVPLLYSMLELGGVRPAVPALHKVGDQIRLAATPEQQARVAFTPEGASIALPDTATEFDQTRVPGIYTLVRGGATNRFAINLDPVESRTAPLAPDDLERLGVPLARTSASPAVTAVHQARLQSAELEGRQKLWRWLVVAALGLVLTETLLAGWAARRTTTVEATP